MRKPVIAGNWKMYKTIAEAVEFVTKLKPLVANVTHCEVVVAPPMLGEMTLLPRRRSLRIQVEAAALFQAVHLVHLLDPEPAG